MGKFNSQETLNVTKKFCELVNQASDYYKELYDTVGRCDRETSDIVHDIEFSTFNVKEGNIKARTLKKVRRERRAAKDEMEYVLGFKKLAEIYKNMPKELVNLCATLEKIKVNQDNRTYTPREKAVIADEEIS